ncbi:MAG TPA: hydrogenase nickel incorporation protein HypB [Fimbriimonadaceae bacterium]|nr:hydrogenase nickel incorporation protein HypB [Fimbriimonadaceae bacterium]
MSRVLDIGQAILAKNQGLADRLRQDFAARGVFVLNVVSSPGSGKTEWLAKTLERIAGQIPTAVIVGDLATDHDAQRLSGKGAKVLQVNTDGYCHLEANMIRAAVDELGIDQVKLLIIENVGNLVCPSTHDLGEDLRVVLFSVTEGEDKPLKYPTIFKTSQVVILSKCDLAEAVGLDRDLALRNVANVAPQATLLETSARTMRGMDEWCNLLTRAVASKTPS